MSQVKSASCDAKSQTLLLWRTTERPNGGNFNRYRWIRSLKTWRSQRNQHEFNSDQRSGCGSRSSISFKRDHAQQFHRENSGYTRDTQKYRVLTHSQIRTNDLNGRIVGGFHLFYVPAPDTQSGISSPPVLSRATADGWTPRLQLQGCNPYTLDN